MNGSPLYLVFFGHREYRMWLLVLVAVLVLVGLAC